MAPPRVFITGATGYVGGDFLHVIARERPEWVVSALVRDPAKASVLLKEYPEVRVVEGDLDSVDVVEREVEQSDLVYHFASCSHLAGAQAIARGAQRHTPERPVHVIHTSGVGVTTYEDLRHKTWGIERTKTFDDWDGIEEVVSLPDVAPHRKVDATILTLGELHPNSVKTAIICPPLIHGPGRGPCHKTSMQAYWMSTIILERKRGFVIGTGKTWITEIHLHDLNDLQLRLGDASQSQESRVTWGRHGYYFAENGMWQWGPMFQHLAQIAKDKGYIETVELDRITDEEALKLHPKALTGYGTNQRVLGIRARKLLGWEPQRPQLWNTIPDILDLMARKL